MKYDVAVIGGGPAGMMAAGRAGELGARVILVEKNKHLGKKLLITGKGRCNITNKTESVQNFIKNFGQNGKFLFSALHSFGIEDVINFFENNGVEIKVERGQRVFPVSDKSQDVLNALARYLKDQRVEIQTEKKVRRVVVGAERVDKILLHDGDEILADNFIISTGGKSYPSTGSTGEAYAWLKELGHNVIEPTPSLVPIIVKEKIVSELEGLSLKNVEISVLATYKKIASRFGEAVFTSNGLSGPIILDLSREIKKYLPGDLRLKIDFKPALDYKDLDKRVQRDFQEFNNKLFRNSLEQLLPQKLIPVIVKLSKIDPDKRVNLITKEERRKLLVLLKAFEVRIEKLTGFDRAIVTAGGVDVKEVDPKTMQSKLINNLFFAGEVLDLDGPTGGYNLQVCWSTGYVAGNSIKNNY